MINVHNLSLQLGKRVLFQQASLTIQEGQKAGLIGKNGAGKSTLFELILQKIEPDQGVITFPPGLRIAHVAQETPALDRTALDYVMDGDAVLRNLEQQLEKAEKTEDGEQIAHFHMELATIDAYTAPARAAKLLAGLGFSYEQQQTPVKSFSGGWRMRLNLAQALMKPSDLLLLDEPTNHLDIDAVMWLEEWLQYYPGTLIIVSHDRDFLDHVVNYIVHVHQHKLTLYKGNYSSFEVQRANQLAVQQASYEKQQLQMSHIQSYIDRFRYKASKAKQAQSRIKALERISLISAVQADSEFQFSFFKPDKMSNPLITLTKVDLGYGKETLLRDINLALRPETRLGLLGLNGAGKSTLLKCLCGELAPQAGEIIVADTLRLGYYAQHQLEQIDIGLSPLQHLQKLDPSITIQQARTFLGGFGFKGDMALEAMRHFSGGEKARLVLASLVWQRPNVLLLDEPTNHLDLEMREALILALQGYMGALVTISHDRHFMRSVCDELCLVANKAVNVFEGDLNDYLSELKNLLPSESKTVTEKSNLSRKDLRKQNADKRNELKILQNKATKLEQQVIKLTAELAELTRQLGDETFYQQNPAEVTELLIKQGALQNQLNQAEEQWLSACNELEKTDIQV